MISKEHMFTSHFVTLTDCNIFPVIDKCYVCVCSSGMTPESDLLVILSLTLTINSSNNTLAIDLTRLKSLFISTTT